MTKGTLPAETAEARLKRMAMRSWRRGMKEMDLVLGPFADAHLPAMSAAELTAYDALLAENDQDLMAWVLGQSPAPDGVSTLLKQITDFSQGRLIP